MCAIFIRTSQFSFFNWFFFPSDRKDESPKLRWKKDQTYWKKNSDNSGNEDIQLEGNLSAEYSMTTLDTLELLVQVRLINLVDVHSQLKDYFNFDEVFVFFQILAKIVSCFYKNNNNSGNKIKTKT